MRAATPVLVLLLCASPAAAQYGSTPFWEQATPRTPGGLRVLSAAHVTGFTIAGASTLLASSATLRLSSFTAALHAGALHDLDNISAGGLTLSTQFRMGGTTLDVRAGGGAAPDDHKGPSITTIGASLARRGLSFSLRSSILPATRDQTYETRTTERDTTFVINHIVPGQPRRAYTDMELSYHHSIKRVTLDAALGHRFGPHIEAAYWARAGAMLNIVNGVAIGGRIERDPGAPWLQTRSRNAATLFVRLDPLVSAAVTPAIPVHARPQPLRITTTHATTFTLLAPGAKRVEITGTFSNWEPVSLQKGSNGEWTAALPLARGVYHITMRIDGRAWHAPPGLATIPDEFGGEAGVFEVR